MSRRSILIATLLASLVVFCVVQDRITADGARRYVAMQRDAQSRHGGAVTIAQVMAPAVAHGVRQGLLWAGMVLVAGLGVAAAAGRRAKGTKVSGR